MKHIFIENGKEIEIVPERWVWGVIYNDGTELHQFASDGTFHQFKEIDWSKAQLFTMYRYDDMAKNFTIVVRDGVKIFHKYRNTHPEWEEDQNKTYRTYVFGYQIKTGGKPHTVYNHILPDDRMIQSSEDDVDLVAFNIGR